MTLPKAPQIPIRRWQHGWLLSENMLLIWYLVMADLECMKAAAEHGIPKVIHTGPQLVRQGYGHHFGILRYCFRNQLFVASWIIRSYTSRALLYAASASFRSSSRIWGDFMVQHWSTACRHHSALRFEARTGLPSTSTKIGFVWTVDIIRSATQLDFWTG